MIKSTKMLKRLGATFLVVLMSIESFAAVVGDNDGAAFITKAEFDSMKNDFQSQLDRYNSSLDNKIDGAIASYLNGVRISKISHVTPIVYGNIYMLDKTAGSEPRYHYAPPYLVGDTMDAIWSLGSRTDNRVNAGIALYTPSSESKKSDKVYKAMKLVVRNIDDTKKIAAWAGWFFPAVDEVNVDFASKSLEAGQAVWGVSDPGTISRTFGINGQSHNLLYKNVDLYGKQIALGYSNAVYDSSTATWSGGDTSGWNIRLNKIKHDWGQQHLKNVVLFGNTKKYDCFSNQDQDRNWCYFGSSEDFCDYPNTDQSPHYVNAFLGPTFRHRIFPSRTTETSNNQIALPAVIQDWSGPLVEKWYYNSSRNDYENWKSSGQRWLWPCVGFETTYIDNFNKLYLQIFDIVAEQMVDQQMSGYSSLLRDSQGVYHVPIFAGLPITQTNSNEKIEMDVRFKNWTIDTNNTSNNFGKESNVSPSGVYLWAKDAPFTSDDPNTEANLTISGDNIIKGTGADYNNGYYLSESSGKITITNENEKAFVWLKWSINGNVGGGLITVPNDIVIVSEG